jgi:hypothetical protein
MSKEMIFPLKSLPGIKRDGTMYEGNAHVDGQWVRWQRGLPRKIGGYRSISKYLNSVARSLHIYPTDGYAYTHAGEAAKLERFTIDSSGNTSVVSDRTPGALTASPNNLWQFDIDTTTAVAGIQLVAQVAPNLEITNSTGGQLFYGDAFGTGALTQITGAALPANMSATGGILSLHPYTVVFGNSGYVAWTPDLTSYTVAGANNAYVTGQKIVKGLPLRGGGGYSPSALLWSLDSLLRMSYIGGTPTFQFDTLSSNISVLSTSGIIEYDGIYFWAAEDRFLMFNGVVQEVPNAMNVNYFFDNLNRAQRQKVFAFKVPRWGEIWWCFPFGSSTEPNAAVIYNVRENTWYDTMLPEGGRAAGAWSAIHGVPVLSGVSGPSYRMWMHETGVNMVDGVDIDPIQSYFETSDFALPNVEGITNSLYVSAIEPDFVQSGDMTVQVHGRANARSPEVQGETHTFTAPLPASTDQQIVYLKEQRRQLRFRFESNVIDGDYQMGLVLIHGAEADGTILG